MPKGESDRRLATEHSYSHRVAENVPPAPAFLTSPSLAFFCSALRRARRRHQVGLRLNPATEERWLRGQWIAARRGSVDTLSRLGQFCLDHAPLRSASLRFALMSFASLRFASLRLASIRFAALRSAPPRFALVRSAPLRSGRMSGFSSRHAFQASTPCLSI